MTNKRDGIAIEYLVHYTGWNNRYDEWIRRSRIADNLSWSPTRAKKKSNQTEVNNRSSTFKNCILFCYYNRNGDFSLTSQSPPGYQTFVNQNEPPQSSQQNQNSGKTQNDRIKRSSTSPVSKNRAKNLIKSGINKQMKNMKNKFESKPKKALTQKGKKKFQFLPKHQ